MRVATDVSQLYHNTKMPAVSIKVIRRKDYTHKDGNAQLYVQVIINRKKLTYHLGISCKESEWDADKEKLNRSFKDYADYNLVIQSYINRISQTVIDMRLANMAMTIENFAYQYRRYDAKVDLIKYIEFTTALKEKSVAKGTWERYQVSAQKLKEFKSSILFSDLSPKFLIEYNHWLEKVKRNNQNTRSQEFSTLSMFLAMAKEDGIFFNNPFKNFKKPKATERIDFLTPEQVKKMIDIYRSMKDTDGQKKYLRMFLFMIGTGMRVSDAVKVKRSQYDGNSIAYVPTKTQKKGNIVYCKITEFSKEFMNPEGDYIGLNCSSDSYRNKMNQIKKKYDLSFKVNTHIARHTFATLYILMGGSPVALQKALDHYSIEETMKYVHTVESYKSTQTVMVFDELKKIMDKGNTY